MTRATATGSAFPWLRLLSPLYACLVERKLPFFVCVGVPGPRIPMEPQLVEQLDELAGSSPSSRS